MRVRRKNPAYIECAGFLWYMYQPEGAVVLFQTIQVNEFINDGVDSKTGCGMNIQFVGNILSMRDDGMG